MRQMIVARPFAGGYRSDVPDYALNPNECAYAQDLIYPFGIAQQRWGWTYDGTTADVAANLVGVDRSRYPVADSTVTTTSDSAGAVYIHNAAASGTAIWTNPSSVSTTWIPRCMYNGEVIYCAQDGLTPLLRYAGSPLSYAGSAPDGLGSVGTGTWQMAAGSSEITVASVSFPAGTARGAFASVVPFAPFPIYSDIPALSVRILALNSSTSITVDSIRNASASAISSPPTKTSDGALLTVAPFGFAFPGVSVWDAGIATSYTSGSWRFAGADIASAGIKTTGSALSQSADSLLVLAATAGSPHFMSTIASVSSGSSPQTITTLAAPGGTPQNEQYKIMRRLPFKDATVHKNSLWGTGVKQYPNRVYVGPPLWNIGLPPGAVEPFDIATRGQFADLDEYLLQPVDVPSRYDSDPVVALLPTPGPLLVLKGASVYGIYGTYPSYEQTLLTTGAGCVDLRSAISVDGIAYWAGRDGIYMYSGGQIQPLTRGRIEREWQALMRGYGSSSSVSAAVVAGHLIVSAVGLSNTATGEAKIGPDSSNPTDRTFIYDMKAQQWTSRISNARIRNMSSVRVPGEVPSILGVSDDRQGRVIDLTPTITGAKCTNRASQTLADADPTDAAGTGPRMQAWSSSSMGGANGVEGETRMLDLVIHTNLYDSAGTPTATLAVSTAHGESLDENPTTVVTQASITGDSVDRVDRNKRRINRSGRLHQVRVDMSTTSSTTKKTQIPQIVASLRDNRRMT
jgi:hypothetical protein